jgi:aminocarboxymuconate-semialdehyde decarboxylase
MLVDHQWHWMPPQCLDLLKARKEPPRVDLVDDGLMFEMAPGLRIPAPGNHAAEIDEHLRLASEHGIDGIVSSPTLFGEVMHLDAGEAAEMLEFANDLAAEAQGRHADRFVGLALLPMQDSKRSLDVLDKAAAKGLRGVSMLCSIDGAPIATEATRPVFERIEELGFPVVLHPAVRSSTRENGEGFVAEVGIAWMYHTAVAAANLIDSGTLDACPELVVLHPHLGGVFPYVAGRIDRALGEDRSVYDYTRRHFYTDTGNKTRSPAVLQLAIDTYGLDRVLFATDFPFGPIAPNFEHVREFAAPEVADRIFTNALPGLDPTA